MRLLILIPDVIAMLPAKRFAEFQSLHVNSTASTPILTVQAAETQGEKTNGKHSAEEFRQDLSAHATAVVRNRKSSINRKN